MKLLSGESEVVRGCSPQKQPDGCQLNPDDLSPAGIHELNGINVPGVDIEMCLCNEDLCNGKLSIVKLFIHVLQFTYSCL